jgi:hypothetical protein
MNERCCIFLLALCIGSMVPGMTLGQSDVAGFASVRAFGAKGDGVQDDAPAVQAALDKENAVFLPPGTYRLGKRLSMNRSGMALIGSGPATTILKPDASLTTGTIIVAAQSTLQDIEIRGFKLDGSSNPTKVQGIGVNNAKRVRIAQISPCNISGMVGFEGVESFSVSEIAASDLVEFISMIGCKKGVLTNILGVGVDEGFDFFNCEDVEVVGAVLSARDPIVIRPEQWAVGVDLSSSRRITISGCTFTGHYFGVNMKHDFATGVGAPAVEDILIQGCQFHDYRTAGILLAVQNGRSCRIENCQIRTTRPDATGIYGFHGPGSRFDGLVVSDCTIDSTHAGMRVNQYKGITVRDCRITARDFHALHIYESEDLLVSGCRLRSSNETAGNFSGIHAPVIDNNDIEGASGLWIASCRSATLWRNRIANTKGRGITLQWQSDELKDRAALGSVVRDNVIRDWGSASPGNAAVAFVVVGDTDAKAVLATISGNFMELTSNAPRMTQYGISFIGGTKQYEWVSIVSNITSGAYSDFVGLEALGADCLQLNNVFRKDPQ